MTIHEVLGIDPPPGGPHIPASAYQWRDPQTFSRAFKFCVVRNPWDRLVSAFHFLKSSPWPDDQVWSQRHLARFAEFQSFLAELQNPFFRNLVLTQLHFHPQASFVTDAAGMVRIDRVLEFERLADGLRDISNRLHLKIEADDLVRRNTSEHRDYREYYDEAGRDVVARMYRRDLHLFGHDFDGGDGAAHLH